MEKVCKEGDPAFDTGLLDGFHRIDFIQAAMCERNDIVSNRVKSERCAAY